MQITYTLYLIVNNKDNILNVERDLIVLWKIYANNFDAIKKLGYGYVYLCVASQLFFNTTTEQTNQSLEFWK